MKKYFFRCLFLPFFLLSCISTSVRPLPTSDVIKTETVVPTTVLPNTSTPEPALPSNISDDLTIVYKVYDDINLYSIWIWKQNTLQKILQQKYIYNPIVSSNGEWLVFLQTNLVTDNNLPTSEVWLMRTDGSDLQLLLSSDELNNLYNDDRILLIDQIDWIPNQEKLLFTTIKNFKDRPGVVPNFDLYSLDLERQIKKLAEPEDGGLFTFSPDGKYVAVASKTRIGLINLETKEQQTSLEFDSFWQACECYFVPKVFGM